MNRREFLKVTAAAALVSGCATPWQPTDVSWRTENGQEWLTEDGKPWLTEIGPIVVKEK